MRQITEEIKIKFEKKSPKRFYGELGKQTQCDNPPTQKIKKII